MLDSIMLRIVYDLQGLGIATTDREAGSVEQFYLGDEQWRAEERPGIEESIVSSQWIAAINWAQSSNLSSEEVRQSPELISRERETPLHRPDGQTGYLLN